VLLCVDATPTALEALRLAVDFAAGWRASVRAVYVVQDSVVAEAIDAASGGLLRPAEERLKSEAGGLLAHVENVARARDVAIETVIRRGEPFEEIMLEARRFEPDLIVIGRPRRRGPGSTVLGTVTAHLLEFTEWPVLVVPDRRRAARAT
jgi:nucleotide-binding universal stress UspA family protein